MFVARSAYWLLLLSTALGAVPAWSTAVVHANGIDDDRGVPWYPAGEGREAEELSGDEDSEVKTDFLVLAGLVEYRHVIDGNWVLSVAEFQPLPLSILRRHDDCRAPPGLFC